MPLVTQKISSPNFCRIFFLSKIVSWRVICTSTSTTIPTAVAADGVNVVVVVVNVATAACRPRRLLSPAPRRTCPPVS